MVNSTAPHLTIPRQLTITLGAMALAVLTSCERPVIQNLREPVKDVPVTMEEDSEINPISSPEAVRGGEFTTWAGGYPKSLNYWLDQNTFSGTISSLMFEGLAGLHPTEDRWVGGLAKSWEISDDVMEFTFHIHPAAKWSDGQPVTAADVRFYYDTIMDPRNLTTPFRVALDRLEPPEVIDEKTLKIRAKGVHWSNFQTAAGLMAFPKHVWGDKDFNAINFEFPVVSGPYTIEKVEHNQFILMKRRGDWWARVKKENQFVFNFDYIRYRAMEDRSKALEAFKNGEFDMYAIYTSALWAQQTDFDQIKKNWVIRQEVYNEEPKAFQGLCMNLRRELFQDKNVREALSYLLNRKLINEKIMFNSYFLLNSYFPDLYENNRKPDAEFYEYDPTKARELLAASGWKPNAEGILEKGGKTLSIKFLHYGETLPHFNIYLEDLKSVGIDARIDLVDAATQSKRLDNHDFDMVWQNFGAARERDPEPSWTSKIADMPSTSNYAGVRDAKIDELIEKQKTILDIGERNEILKQIDSRLMEIVPYVLLWQSDRHRLLYWNRFGTPKYVLDKYNREDVAIVYWWHDAAKAKALEEARKNGRSLPAEPEIVRWAD